MTDDIDLTTAQAQRLERVAAQLDSMLRQPGATARLSTHPGEDEWSVMQILGHLAESIPYWLDQCRNLIAATGKPPTFGRKLDAPERLVGVDRGLTEEINELLPRVVGEILAAAQAIRRMSLAERGKTGLHIRDGELSVAQVIERFIVTHVEGHLTQIQAALQR